MLALEGSTGCDTSSNKAEWFALSEAVKEIVFVLQLLESINIKVKLPVIVRIDNVSAIFMSKNITTTSPSKHIDICTKYVNEYVEDGVLKLKIIFIKSQDNDSDIMTKTLIGEFYDRYSKKLIARKGNK